ncbi:DUF2783 domain-containing protein [Paracoccus stylophorae]|uniref:DUF2783 domain-containing protein n=1 Tax=Paracoccus stylophorae TaxID=659350 RepID=A0ABY7SVG4_9RHOB|nr:DUF2783 domain-containing protein [Paracoccus stylophorae]WCR10884.1 DUF2783 domain-containing protein [Paracoccus stylophorae]
MSALNLAPNLTDHDDLYQSLIDMHEGLSEQESLKLWSRLTLILMNHIGDRAVIEQAIEAARPR